MSDRASEIVDACADHWAGVTSCRECGLDLDRYGNTEDSFRFCSYPDCGCDGERLCMAGEANADARECNVEGMYRRKDAVATRARMRLLQLAHERKAGDD